jgi:hypothetical protein
VDEGMPQGGPASFSEALSAAVAERGVSLEWLRSRLADLGTPLSVATLSYWRSGRRQPEHQTSLHAIETLEEVLYLPAGHLTSRLGPSRRRGPRARPLTLAERMSATPGTRAVLERLGYDPDSRESLHETSTQVVLDVDMEGRGRSVVTRSVFEALSDGARALPEIFELDQPGGPPPEFRAVSGCAIGATHLDPEAGTFGYEIVLERPLRAGETAIAEHEVVIPVEAPVGTFFEIAIGRRVREAVLWVRFDPRRVPALCEAYTEDTAIPETKVLSVSGTTSVHHIVRNAGPGTLGIRWHW